MRAKHRLRQLENDVKDLIVALNRTMPKSSNTMTAIRHREIVTWVTHDLSVALDRAKGAAQ